MSIFSPVENWQTIETIVLKEYTEKTTGNARSHTSLYDAIFEPLF